TRMARPRKYTAEQVLNILEFIDPNESDIDNDSTDDEDYVPDPLQTGRSRQDSSFSESDNQHQIQP
ncbi:piggyBac transposable element-derived protein 3, partial [Biomphalaria glabrata]